MEGSGMMKCKAWRSPEYLAWVRTLPCCFCGMGPADAHHEREAA